MKAITKTIYQAHDGRVFDTPEECKAHERANAAAMLCYLSEQSIAEAVGRSTERGKSIADAIEHVAYLISIRRKEQGEMRRCSLPLVHNDGQPVDIDNDYDVGAG